MPARIPLPTDDELTPEHREMLDKLPPLNVFRMVAGTRRGPATVPAARSRGALELDRRPAP